MSLATFWQWWGLRQKAARLPIRYVVAGDIHKGQRARVSGGRGGGGGGLMAFRAWNFVSAMLRYAAAGRERGNAHLPWR